MARWQQLWGRLKAAVHSGPGRDRWQRPERVLEVLRVAPGARVADVGAGGGYFTFRLADAVGPDGRVFAVDPDPDTQAHLRRRAAREGRDNVVTIRPDDGDVPALPEPVDLALVVDAFHHLPEDRVHYLTGVGSWLGADGRLAIIEPQPRWYLFGHATDPGAIRTTAARAGYVLAEQHDLPRQALLVFRQA